MNPCKYCIEMECENNGVVCPFWSKQTQQELESVEEIDNEKDTNTI